MCNRITLTLPDAAMLRRLLALDDSPDDASFLKPRYNVAPTQAHPVVMPTVPLALHAVTWGLGARRQLNTRLEKAMVHRLPSGVVPCAVPVTGFLEWDGPKDARTPVLFEPADEPLMLLAGLSDGTGFSILTTTPSDVVAPVHDRMPVQLSRHGFRHWLQARVPSSFEALLAAAGGVTLVPRRVSRRVNSVAHDDPECLAPPTPDEKPRQLTLL